MVERMEGTTELKFATAVAQAGLAPTQRSASTDLKQV
jgi:hypothetical protein